MEGFRSGIFFLNCWGFQVGGKHPKLFIFISLCIALYGLFTYYIIFYTSRFLQWNRVNFQAPSSDHPTQRKVTRAVDLNQREPLAVSTGHKMLHSTCRGGILIANQATANQFVSLKWLFIRKNSPTKTWIFSIRQQWGNNLITFFWRETAVTLIIHCEWLC